MNFLRNICICIFFTITLEYKTLNNKELTNTLYSFKAFIECYLSSSDIAHSLKSGIEVYGVSEHLISAAMASQTCNH